MISTSTFHFSGTQSPEVIKIKVQHSGSSDSSPAEQRKHTTRPEVKSSKASEPVSNKREPQTLPNPEPDVNRSKSPRINPSRGVGKSIGFLYSYHMRACV